VCRNRNNRFNTVEPARSTGRVSQPQPQAAPQTLLPTILKEPNQFAHPPRVLADADSPSHPDPSTPTPATSPISDLVGRHTGRTAWARLSISILLHDRNAICAQRGGRGLTLRGSCAQRAAGWKEQIDRPPGEPPDLTADGGNRGCPVQNCLRILNSHPTVIIHGPKRFYL
jgi:hypothetical protein